MIRVQSQISPSEICRELSAVELRFLQEVIQVSRVSIILPVLLTYLYLHVASSRKTNGRSLGTFQKPVLLRKLGSVGRKLTISFPILKGIITQEKLRVSENKKKTRT